MKELFELIDEIESKGFCIMVYRYGHVRSIDLTINDKDDFNHCHERYSYGLSNVNILCDELKKFLENCSMQKIYTIKYNFLNSERTISCDEVEFNENIAVLNSAGIQFDYDKKEKWIYLKNNLTK